MKEKTDLRILKTKKVLLDTLIKLMKQKNFEKIKISDICENALINRSTFYAHYEDKYDLLMDLFENQKVTLLKELEDNNNSKIFSKDYTMNLLSIVINHLEENKEVYSSILANNRNGILLDFLIETIERDVKEKIKSNNEIIESNIPIDFIIKFYSGGLINIGMSLLTQKDNYSKEELLSYLDKLIPDKI